MGKVIGFIHQHDTPAVTKAYPPGTVWECECGERFFVQAGTYIWLPVGKLDVVTIVPEKE